MNRFHTAAAGLSAALNEAVNAMNAAHPDRGEIDPSRFRLFCVDIGQITRDAGRYFPVPDPQAQARWQEFITQAQKASEDCERALDQENGNLFIASMNELAEAGNTFLLVQARIDTVMHDGGY